MLGQMCAHKTQKALRGGEEGKKKPSSFKMNVMTRN